VSELADGWAETTLGVVGDYLNGRGFRKAEWRESGRPIIRIQNLTGTSSFFNYYDGDAEESYVARRGDLLVSWAATLGVFVWPGPEAVVNQHIFKVESYIDHVFHRYLIASVLSDLQRQTHGSGMVHITRSKFDSTPIALPPLAEQRRIVAAIEEHFSRLDAAEESLRRAQSRIRQMRATVLEAAIPAASRVGISDLVSQDRKLAYGVLQPGAHVSDGVPFIRVGDIDSGRIDISSLKHIDSGIAAAYPRTKLEGGEVVITIVGTIGRTAVVPESLRGANVARAVCVIPVADCISSEYVALALGRPSSVAKLESLAHEVARKTLNLEDVRRFRIPIPPLADQSRIVAEVERRLSLVDALAATTAAALKRSAALRRSILERAFSGQLVPQDPNDEPASVLLERIRAERESAPAPKRQRRSISS
jgi:type I restriction enzyme S subunit